MKDLTASRRKRLQALVGEWRGTGTVAVAGERFPITVRWSCESIAAGYSVRAQAEIAGIPGMEHFMDVEQFGYDDADPKIHAGTVCNAGEVHHLVGGWFDDGLRVEDTREHLEVRLIAPDALQLHVVNKGGGPVFDVALQRARTDSGQESGKRNL
ncbi:MAG TPA: hypothetical protein VNI83_10965 [Vicinamibacterales bacterium]|nr:hypothetical protein [Vicinamibacterales bacterium]